MPSSTSPNVLILGATSAIAAEVAARYAGRGARLYLVGRSGDKLEAVAERCRGAAVSTLQADFGLLSGCADIVETARATLGRLDVALIAHGDLGSQRESERSFDEAERLLRVNLLSVVALLVPLANAMEAAGQGRLAVMGSVAGERGRPRNYTYGTAKAALHTYLEGLRSRLYPAGVSVTTLKLGPVDTPMTREHRKNLLFARAPEVARSIVRAIDGREGEVYLPSYWRAIMALVRHTPEALFQRVGALSGR